MFKGVFQQLVTLIGIGVLWLASPLLKAAEFSEVVKQVSRSVVGIAIYTPLESRAPQLRGTGFVVAGGDYVVTNYHVVNEPLDPQVVSHYVALVGEGKQPAVVRLETIAIDPVHDLAILKVSNPAAAPELFPLRLADQALRPAGTEVAITGYPIGAILGLYAATHVGYIAAISPDVIPARNADQLTIDMLKRLKEPFMIYQLDLTAYPGNSGSPLYDKNTGEVLAVLNKVFVSQVKEAAISSPSGISYAIPIKHLLNLAKQHNINL